MKIYVVSVAEIRNSLKYFARRQISNICLKLKFIFGIGRLIVLYVLLSCYNEFKILLFQVIINFVGSHFLSIKKLRTQPVYNLILKKQV